MVDKINRGKVSARASVDRVERFHKVDRIDC